MGAIQPVLSLCDVPAAAGKGNVCVLMAVVQQQQPCCGTVYLTERAFDIFGVDCFVVRRLEHVKHIVVKQVMIGCILS
jgi:hypothetical protein